MTAKASRRCTQLVVLAFGAGILLLLARSSAAALRNPSFVTGWCLAALVVGLLLLNLRKSLPFLPLGSAAAWLQVHLQLGALGVILFFEHIGWRLPTGGLEGMLALVFTGTCFSGVVGLVLSRVLPPRMARRGEPVIFERLPMLRRELYGRVETLVHDSIQQTGSTTIAAFFHTRLMGFLGRPRHFWHHLVESRGPWHSLEQEFANLDRYLNAEERRIVAEIVELARQKDHLDYQRAVQLVLKGWLFVHIPLGFSMGVLLLLHVVLVYAFMGGI